MTAHDRDTRIKELIAFIDAADDYLNGLLDYATVSRRSRGDNDNPDQKRLKGPIEWAGGGRIIGVR
jgi:hypothetical protein